MTIDPFSATKEIYGQLYAALGNLGSTGSGVGPQVGHIYCNGRALDHRMRVNHTVEVCPCEQAANGLHCYIHCGRQDKH